MSRGFAGVRSHPSCSLCDPEILHSLKLRKILQYLEIASSGEVLWCLTRNSFRWETYKYALGKRRSREDGADNLDKSNLLIHHASTVGMLRELNFG